MSIEAIWLWTENLSRSWLLSLQAFGIVLITMLAGYLARSLLNRLHKVLQRTSNPWDDAFVVAIRHPLSILIWVVGIAIAAEWVLRNTQQTQIFSFIKPIRDLVVICCIAWFAHRFTRLSELNVLARPNPPDSATVMAVAKLVRVSIIISATLVSLETLGFSISGVLAFGGIGGVAVGFAAKDLLANFFGGLMVHLDRPFSIGDWIRSPDRQIEGTVEEIGWRQTRIRTFDKRPLYVPNSTFTTIAVENPSRMTHRRIRETIGIRYDDANKMSEIVQAVKTMLLTHPEIDTTQTMIVNFDKFAPSSLDFFIYTFTKTTNWIHFHEVKQDVLLKVIEIITQHNAEVAFPTSTLHIPEGIQVHSEMPK